MEDDIQNYPPTDMFRGTHCTITKRIEKIQIQIFNFFSGTLNNNITKTLTFCVQNYLLMRFWQINMSEL